MRPSIEEIVEAYLKINEPEPKEDDTTKDSDDDDDDDDKEGGDEAAGRSVGRTMPPR